MTIGERDVVLRRVVELPDSMNISEFVNRWLSDYFGLLTCQEEVGEGIIFWAPDGACCVKFSSAQEISEEDYEVLKKYISSASTSLFSVL